MFRFFLPLACFLFLLFNIGTASFMGWTAENGNFQATRWTSFLPSDAFLNETTLSKYQLNSAVDVAPGPKYLNVLVASPLGVSSFVAALNYSTLDIAWKVSLSTFIPIDCSLVVDTTGIVVFGSGQYGNFLIGIFEGRVLWNETFSGVLGCPKINPKTQLVTFVEGGFLLELDAKTGELVANKSLGPNAPSGSMISHFSISNSSFGLVLWDTNYSFCGGQVASGELEWCIGSWTALTSSAGVAACAQNGFFVAITGYDFSRRIGNVSLIDGSCGKVVWTVSVPNLDGRWPLVVSTNGETVIAVTCVFNSLAGSCDSTPFVAIRNGVIVWKCSSFQFDQYGSPFVIDSENNLVVSVTTHVGGYSDSITSVYDLKTGNMTHSSSFLEAKVGRGWIVMGNGSKQMAYTVSEPFVIATPWSLLTGSD